MQLLKRQASLVPDYLRAPKIDATILSVTSFVASPQTDPLKPILTARLFPKLDGLLLELLRSLTPEEWERQTVSPKWKVKDVAAHLLDTALRGLSIGRDGYAPHGPNLDSAAALAAYIDRLNAEGITVYRRLSPAVLISLMETACPQLEVPRFPRPARHGALRSELGRRREIRQLV